MYSETEAQGPSNLPRKFASSRRYGVDRSVIDKGDNNEYDETQHSDGKVLKELNVVTAKSFFYWHHDILRFRENQYNFKFQNNASLPNIF